MTLARGPYKILERPEFPAEELLADAAQEAEFFHATTGKAHHVIDADNKLVYTSQGAPE